jgi:nucleotide-binding universal stress UspA family protein
MTPVGNQQQRIVVGVDGSDLARAAAAYAVHLAEETSDAKIVLAHAYEPLATNSTDPAVERLRDETEKQAWALVNGIADDLRATTDVPISTVISADRPGPFLNAQAAEATMMVVGQDAAGLFERLAFGRVAAHLAATARCPVVIVPAPWHRQQFGYHPVVVAVSGEDLSPLPLARAFEEAAHTKTSVLALHAVPYFATSAEAAQHEGELAEIVAAAEATHPDVVAETLIVRGSPEEHLIRQSVNACAVVVGRPHHGGPSAWMRSVAHAVIKRTRCPLIIVPTA